MFTMRPFQDRVHSWVMEAFGADTANDTRTRTHRFIEEALELGQACGATKAEVLALVEYVYNRPLGERHQEVGGVMLTLATVCSIQGLDMEQCGEDELARVWKRISQIQTKEARKPDHSPLHGASE